MNPKHLIAILLLTFLSGCSSLPYEPIKRQYSGKNELYSKLIKSDNRYVFKGLSTKPGNKLEPWVRLNDMKPMFVTSKESYCYMGIGILGVKNEKSCQSNHENLFRKNEMDGLGKFVSGVIFVASFGTSGTGRMTNIEFDQEEFDKAIQQAVENTNLDSLIGYYDELWQNWRLYDYKYKENREELKAIIDLKDYSEFYKEGDFDFTDLVSFDSKPFKLPNAILNDDIINKDTLRGFQELSFKDLYSEWDEQLNKYHLLCKDGVYKSYHYSIECPSLVTKKPFGITSYHIKITLHSKDFQNVVPQRHIASDKYLQVKILNDDIYISNLSDKFINTDSFSIYYKDKISSLNELNLKLPPYSEKKLSMLDYLDNLPSFHRNQYTLDQASAEDIQFGLAVKYSVSDFSKEHTLLDLKTFKGIQLIEY